MKKKRIFKFLVEILTLASVILCTSHIIAFADNNQLVPLSQQAVEEYKSGLLPGPYGTTVDSIELVEELFLVNLLGYAKIIIGVIAILFITIMGYRLVTSGGEDDVLTNTKKGIAYAIGALVLISMSQDIARIFDMSESTILQKPSEILERVHLFDRQVELIIIFIKYIIGTYAALMVAISGLKLITSGGNDEEVTKTRQTLLLSVGGLLLIYVGDLLIKKVLYNIDKSQYSAEKGLEMGIDPAQGVEEIIGVTNLAITFLGPLAILMLIVAAIMYLTAAGEEEQMNRAKRLLIATGVGFVMIYGAFAAVSTIIAGKLT